uniref:Uncharacterized protein n=1 Tax=Kalanchoe fedtschenkoi TaxID=63787 RepID=A0A7N0UE97_KALFE
MVLPFHHSGEQWSCLGHYKSVEKWHLVLPEKTSYGGISSLHSRSTDYPHFHLASIDLALASCSVDITRHVRFTPVALRVSSFK